MKDLVFLIDSGHGGVISGKYVTAPDKMYSYPSGEVAYEGVINRAVKDHVLDIGQAKGLSMIDVCPSDLDLPLPVRTRIINDLAMHYGKTGCLLISLHSNAGKGTGFEVWTTKGEDLSDRYASLFIKRFAERFPDIKLRKDLIDGDPDKESQFFIQVNSICPSILPEWLFFDNWEDYKKIRSPIEQQSYAAMIVDFCSEVRSINI